MNNDDLAIDVLQRQHLALTAKSIYFVSENSTLDAVMTSYVPRLWIKFVFYLAFLRRNYAHLNSDSDLLSTFCTSALAQPPARSRDRIHPVLHRCLGCNPPTNQPTPAPKASSRHTTGHHRRHRSLDGPFWLRRAPPAVRQRGDLGEEVEGPEVQAG